MEREKPLCCEKRALVLWRVNCRMLGWDTTSAWDQITSTTTRNVDTPYAESTDREDN